MDDLIVCLNNLEGFENGNHSIGQNFILVFKLWGQFYFGPRAIFCSILILKLLQLFFFDPYFDGL